MAVPRPVTAAAIVFVNNMPELFAWRAHLAARIAGARRVFDIEHLIADRLPSPRIQRGPLGWVRRAVGWRSRVRLRARLGTLPLSGTICCSDAVRDRLVEEYAYPSLRTVTVRNGVDLRGFRSMASRMWARERLGIPQDAEVVVTAAALVRQKRLDVLIGAMEIVARRRPSCLCLILGDGPLGAELKAMVEARGLASIVRFVGRVEDVRLHLAAGDLFVLSSDREGLPFALLEAMAAALPSVVTRAGGNAEVVRDGEEGRLVDCGDIDGLAAAMAEVLDLRNERESMGARARARVERDFDRRNGWRS